MKEVSSSNHLSWWSSRQNKWTFQGYQYLSKPLDPSLDLLSLAWSSDSEHKVAKNRTRPQPRSEGVDKHKVLRACNRYTSARRTTWSDDQTIAAPSECNNSTSTYNLPTTEIKIMLSYVLLALHHSKLSRYKTCLAEFSSTEILERQQNTLKTSRKRMDHWTWFQNVS